MSTREEDTGSVTSNNLRVENMELRDWFAGMALQGLAPFYEDKSTGRSSAAKAAYSFANAMMKKRAELIQKRARDDSND